MLKIEKHEVVGIDHAIRGMRNPLNSWDKSDTEYVCVDSDDTPIFTVGNNDLALMSKLSAAGTDHRKFMRMIVVYVDITAPLYWWKEFDTYKVGTVSNSCSTMHKIHDKEFVLDDFSHEKLFNEEGLHSSLDVLNVVIAALNKYRTLYNETKDREQWYQMIQLLPSSYNQKRTIMLNYEVLANMYKSRHQHKLEEWHVFCDWIKTLPYSELITEAN